MKVTVEYLLRFIDGVSSGPDAQLKPVKNLLQEAPAESYVFFDNKGAAELFFMVAYG
jgi:hypothetical protein